MRVVSKTFPGDDATRRLKESPLDVGLETGLDGPGEDVRGGGLAASRAFNDDLVIMGGTEPKRDVGGDEQSSRRLDGDEDARNALDSPSDVCSSSEDEVRLYSCPKLEPDWSWDWARR